VVRVSISNLKAKVDGTISVKLVPTYARLLKFLWRARFWPGGGDAVICGRERLQVKGSIHGRTKDETHLGYCSKETKIPGIFAVGDVRYNSARQAINTAGDGATAAISAERFLSF